MKTRILDTGALKAISPAALAAYARQGGWTKDEAFGDHADIYTGKNRPEIVLPRTDDLADYASVTSRLIGIFSDVTKRDETGIYRDLIGTDHDVVRVRVVEAKDDGSVLLDEGVELVSQARKMLRAAAYAVTTTQPVYRGRANREAAEYMGRVRLGQTEHGSFVVTLMAPVPPLLQAEPVSIWSEIENEPYERQVTRRLVQALDASRDAAKRARSGNGAPAFEQAVSRGVSANLCDALARLIDQSRELEVSVNWAKTRPAPESRTSILFSESDANALKEAARTFRARKRKLRRDIQLFGTVHKLTRGKYEVEGQVIFKVDVDGKIQSVRSMVDQNNYSIATHAHEARKPVTVTGDLERIGRRWQITNAAIRELPINYDIELDLAPHYPDKA